MDYTIFLTVVTGVVTFVVGQILLKLFIEPTQEMRKTIGLIAHAMVERASFIQNPGVPHFEDIKEVSRELRALSAKLQSQLYVVPIYAATGRRLRYSATKLINGLSRIFALPAIRSGMTQSHLISRS